MDWSLEGLLQCPGTRRAQRCCPNLQGKIVSVCGGPERQGPGRTRAVERAAGRSAAAAGHTHLRGGSGGGGGGNRREPGPGREPSPSGAASGAQEWMPGAGGALSGFGLPQGRGCGPRRREGARPTRPAAGSCQAGSVELFLPGARTARPSPSACPCGDPGPGLAPWPWSADLFCDSVPGEALLVSLRNTEGSGQEAPHAAEPPSRGLTPSRFRLTAAAPSPAARQKPGSPRARGQRLRELPIHNRIPHLLD